MFTGSEAIPVERHGFSIGAETSGCIDTDAAAVERYRSRSHERHRQIASDAGAITSSSPRRRRRNDEVHLIQSGKTGSQPGKNGLHLWTCGGGLTSGGNNNLIGWRSIRCVGKIQLELALCGRGWHRCRLAGGHSRRRGAQPEKIHHQFLPTLGRIDRVNQASVGMGNGRHAAADNGRQRLNVAEV